MRFFTTLATTVLLVVPFVPSEADDSSSYKQEFRSVVATADHARVLHIGQQPETRDDDEVADVPYQFTYSAGRFPYHVDRTHSESKDNQGITRGAYSYLDPNRKLQTVRYEANKKEGFKVLSSTLTDIGVEDTPAVASAKDKHRALFEYIAQEHARIGEEHARLAAERAKTDESHGYAQDETQEYGKKQQPRKPYSTLGAQFYADD